MDKFEELMARREQMRVMWLELVASQRASGSEAFYSAGAVLQRDGSLEMCARSQTTNAVMFWVVGDDEGVRVVTR